MTDYDEYPYEGNPYAETHPDHLGAVAALFALSTAPPERCRVLELGCGVGGNLVPMAASLPGSSFVGLDLSARQIEEGMADVRALGLDNIELHAMSILDAGQALGTFDYILCHGVYSWVPEEVQAGILSTCRARLSPRGVAYVSFNALPGWRLRGMLRDLLLREVGPSGTPAERVDRARAFLRFLAHLPAEKSPAQAMLKSELDLLDQVSDSYLLHEHLAEHNRPAYFADFARAAARAGLQYVADAHLQLMRVDRFGPEAEATMKRMARDVIETEQLLDYLEVRLFRRALLCHEEAALDRQLDHRRLLGLRVFSTLGPASPDVDPAAPEIFRGAGGLEVSTTRPLLKAALHVLAAERPGGLPFVELCARAGARLGGTPSGEPTGDGRASLGNDVLTLFAQGALRLGAGVSPCVATPGPRPETTPFIRLQASLGRPSATSLLHRRVALDRLDHAMLPRMDGTLGPEALAAAVVTAADEGRVSIEVDGVPRSDLETVREVVDQRLRHHARAGLLCAVDKRVLPGPNARP
jgi:SAM-dependent methyltransferase